MQTYTPHHLIERPRKDALVKEFIGKQLEELRTPAMVINRATFAINCAKMHERAADWGATFRAHLKTHKTTEGTRLQLDSAFGKSHAVVVSTLMEAWEVVKSGLVADGTVNDILYGVPVAINKLGDLAALSDELAKYGAALHLMVDHPAQVQSLESFEGASETKRRWSCFVKVDGGQKRAGVPPTSLSLKSLLELIFASPALEIYGFYAHAGNAYGSTSLSSATSFLSSEVEAVNAAAEVALSLRPEASTSFVLSVGSTPTAHAANAESRAILKRMLHGTLELHAGNYPMLDLQQKHTSLIGEGDIAQKVLATVISNYPGRGESGVDEAMIDAGAIAFSKDGGPSGGYGDVIGRPWRVGRISQEHGILVSMGQDNKLEVGEVVEIIGQHACLIAAAYPWFYVVDGGVDEGRTVVDVWVPWKGW
ncbi:hypothetical protein HGRIS_007956 [Hohenbuehelia grisea]|uniref:D-serine dehydratase-like domain-containing protein n=1 Tax=Hohenbuehelia grisea TaxID=104357 RepID=A0ABR3J6X1_9AGAR